MLLAADVGNTQTVFAVYDGARLVEHWRVATESERTADELAVLLGRLLELRELGFEDVGGVLAPGIEISMEALFARAARLTKVDFVEPDGAIGKTTTAALQAGVVYGFAGQVDGIVGRMRAELGSDAKVVATGGLADLIAPHSETISETNPLLTLEGLRLVWERNR